MADLVQTLRNLRTRALPTRDERRALLALAVPIVAVQVGQMLMGVVDTLLVGHVSPTALAAVALGNVFFFGVSSFGIGVLLALDPVVAQAVGADDTVGVARGIQRGILLAGALAIPPAVLLLFGEEVLRALGQPAEVLQEADAYARFISPSILPFYLFIVLRQSLQALHRTRPILVSIVIANLLNAVLDWALIYGKFGLPAGGVTGAATATTISRWVMPLLLLAIAADELRPALRPWRKDIWHLRPLLRTLHLGAPIGLQTMLEYTAFGAAGLLMGRLGALAVAAHQIAINVASLTFMVPLGIGAAAAVLVGRAVGAGDMPAARRHARAALVFGVGFMSLAALVLLAIPRLIGSAYTTDPATLALAAQLLPVAGWFQLFDGVQAVTAGILRGSGDTRVPMLVNLGGFWAVGIPLGLWLAFRTSLGPVGLWWGLAGGLVAVALVLAWRVRKLMRREIRRVVIDAVVVRREA